MPAGDYNKSAIGTEVLVQIGADFNEVEGLSNVEMSSPDNTNSVYQLLNGRSIQRSGSAQPYSLSAERAANMGSLVFRTLFNARNGQAGQARALVFRVDSAPEEPVYTPTVSANVTAAIASSDGAVTFAGTLKPEIDAALAGYQIAVGHAIKLTGKYYSITEIDDSDNVTAVEIPTWEFPSADVAADEFTIVNPKWRYQGLAHVNQIGNFSAATDGNPVTDSFALGFVQSGIPWQVLTS